jgi:hypothetical protein
MRFVADRPFADPDLAARKIGDFPMLALRLIAPNDYRIPEDRQPIARIRLARERTPPIRLWTVTVTIPRSAVLRCQEH